MTSRGEAATIASVRPGGIPNDEASEGRGNPGRSGFCVVGAHRFIGTLFELRGGFVRRDEIAVGKRCRAFSPCGILGKGARR